MSADSVYRSVTRAVRGTRWAGGANGSVIRMAKHGTVLDEVEAAVRAGHEVAHRAWPKAGVSGWAGWKSTPKARRNHSGVLWVGWRGFTCDEMVVDIARLARSLDAMSHALAAG